MGMKSLLIYGAGISGSLAALSVLNNLGNDWEVYIYEKNTDKPCDKDCGWVWLKYNEVKELHSSLNVGIDPEDYVLEHISDVVVHDTKIRVGNVVVFNRPRYIKALRDSLKDHFVSSPDEVNPDLVIDATGSQRAIIGSENENITKIYAKVHRIRLKKDLDPRTIYVYVDSIKGYACLSHIKDDYWRIGAGSIYEGPFGGREAEVTRQLLNLCKKLRITKDDIVEESCSCEGELIHDRPSKISYTDGEKTIAIGEAAGYISAFGDGCATSIYSVDDLLRAMKESNDVKEIIKKYGEYRSKTLSYLEFEYNMFEKAAEGYTHLFLYMLENIHEVAKLAEKLALPHVEPIFNITREIVHREFHF